MARVEPLAVSAGGSCDTEAMSRINGRSLGVWSLRLDAVYCLLLGAFVAATGPQIATVVALPPLLLTAGGLLVVGWSGAVLWMVFRLRLRLALRLVLVVNLIAAVLIAAAALTASGAVIVIAVLSVALDVALFASSQLVAIRRIGPQTAAPVCA